MSNSDKPFVVYKRASGSFTIAPRGPNGWAQFAIWVALLVPLCVWFLDHLAVSKTNGDVFVGVALVVFGLMAWLICGLWWMRSRAEIVDVVIEKRDRQLKERRNRRRDRNGNA